MPDYVTTASGAYSPTTVSSAAYLVRPYPLAIQVPSLSAGSEVRLQFATTSGGSGTGDFWSDLQKFDGTAAPFVVYSGAGPGVGYLPFGPPTPYVRVSLVASQTQVRTFTLLAVATYT